MLMLAMLMISVSNPIKAREIAPPPRAKNTRPYLVQEHPMGYIGEVMAATMDSITISGKDPYDRDSPIVVRRFKAGKHLAKGEQDPWESAPWNYRLSDVKEGDKVSVVLRAEGDDDLCLAIRITRRPRGMVPPAPFEDPDVPHKHHENMNAYQANEELGIPLPLHLNENYQRWLSDWTSWHYHKFCKEQERIAPPPRPVIRK